MAWEAPGLVVSFPTTSTGLVRYQFVSISTNGNAVACTTNLIPVGVAQDGTTYSTAPPTPTAIPVMVSGISKVYIDAASTVGVGQLVAASTGGVKGLAAEDTVAGLVVAGTSGSGARVVSVLLSGPSASTATV